MNESIEELLASGAVVPDRPGSKRLVPAAQSVVLVPAKAPFEVGQEIFVRHEVYWATESKNVWPGIRWPEGHTPENCLFVAAPAPSSLAGEEDVQKRVERIVFEDFYGSSVAGSKERLAKALIREFGLAALSPEAPAREGEDTLRTVGPIDYDKLRSIIHSATNAVLPFANAPMKTPFSTQERAGMQVEIADLIVADLEKAGGRAPALTRRHEAPAEGAGERFTEGATLPDGAISGTDDGQTVWLESSTGGAHRLGIWGGLSLRFEEADGSSVVRDYEDVNLRARSSAPEAREGEAVAWRWRFMADAYGVDGAAPGDWKYQEAREQVPAAGQWRVEQQPLYTHPAAPSADKLRIAVEALEKVAYGDGGIGTHRAITQKALAALEAEG